MEKALEIYVLFEEGKSGIVDVIAEFTKGMVVGDAVHTDVWEIHVEDNEDYDSALAKDEDKGFLHYHYILGIRFHTAEQEVVIEHMSGLLAFFFLREIPAVATSDFWEA